MIYLTPSQLRAMDLGVNMSGLTDAQLAQYIAQASLTVNTVTLAPNLPTPHDFRGGTVTGETHTWPVDPYERMPQRRVFPFHRPVLDVTSVRIYATKTQYIEFSASEIYYEPSEGWIEPASANMTSFGLFGAALMPFIGLSHPFASLDYTYGAKYPTVERLYPATTADTWQAIAGFWDAVEGATVTVNGTPRVANLTIDYLEGTVLFDTTIPASTDAVEVSYVGTLHPNIARATGLIAAQRLIDRGLSLSGLGGLKSIRVAELAIERATIPGQTRAGDTRTFDVPKEALDLLAEFIFYPIAFA